MAKKYRIHMSPEEREQLQKVVKAGKTAASRQQRMQILLAADASKEGGESRNVDIAKVMESREGCRLPALTSSASNNMTWRCS